MKAASVLPALLLLVSAAAAAAQVPLAEQALQHLAEGRPASPAPAASARAQTPPDQRGERLATFTLGTLEEHRAGGNAGSALPSSGNRGGMGLRLLVPFGLFGEGLTLALVCYVSRGRALNYGLRYTRALLVGGFFAGLWLWFMSLGEIASRGGETLIVELLVVPAVLLWGAPLYVAGKELLCEYAFFRRWFSFERGGSARWAGPRSYRRLVFTAFRRRADPQRGYLNA